MIARFRILLPFSFSVRQADDLPPREFDKDGYHIRVLPPYKAVLDPSMIGVAPIAENIEGLRPADPQTPVETIRMDSSATVQSNCLQVDFMKPDFDRRRDLEQNAADPSRGFIFRVANSFLSRYRSAGQVPYVRLLSPELNFWHLRYLADDESILPEDPALRRGFGVTHFSGRLSGLNRTVWDLTWSFPFEFEPKAWESLLLDAEALLPEVGPSIMVAYAALETFITWALDELVVRRALPTELWEWINDRGRHEKEPSVAERFDILLKVLSGRSLRDENALWQQFQSLRKARNSFSHEGRAELDDREMTAQDALQCISHAKAIVDWVENLLPRYLGRPRIGKIQWNVQIGI